MPLSLREINHLKALTSPRGCPAKIRSLSPKQSRNSESNAMLLSSSLLQDYRELPAGHTPLKRSGDGQSRQQKEMAPAWEAEAMPEHHLVFGVSPRLALLSSPDRRSTWDRRSPVNRFFSSERVSFPDRLSLVVRLSPDRFRSSPIACLRWLSRINLDGADYRRLRMRERAARGLKNGLSERHLYQSLPCATAQLSRSDWPVPA